MSSPFAKMVLVPLKPQPLDKPKSQPKAQPLDKPKTQPEPKAQPKTKKCVHVYK